MFDKHAIMSPYPYVAVPTTSTLVLLPCRQSIQSSSYDILKSININAAPKAF